jgi:pimeloyl-ACP methyl ester carboxylesterase
MVKLAPVQPETRYARSGDVHIAYQVVGDAGPDLVFVPGWISHVDYFWEEPRFAAFLRRLASFSRLILLDRRGTGLSDRTSALPPIEERMDDVRAVMDAAGAQRAALFGVSEGGPMCIAFAATYPERTSALVLFGTFARLTRAPGYEIGLPPEVLDEFIELVSQQWGTGISARPFAPSLAADETFTRSWARLERFAVSPAGIRTLLRNFHDTDVRDVLPLLRVPTLILHRVDDQVTRIAGARYMAERIPGARLVELPGIDHIPWVGDTDALVGEIEELLTGVRLGPGRDRVLATVLFTDIVGSTEQAATRGDRDWRTLLDTHHGLVRRELARHRGREVRTIGDGFFATFDGPARAIHCASAIRDGVRSLGIDIRAGLHAGECELLDDDVRGIAVHIGARVAERAAPGEVLVSNTVKDLVAGSGLRFLDRGTHELRGVPGEWRLFALDR